MLEKQFKKFLKKIFKKELNELIIKFRVKFEDELPPQYVITKHAKGRIGQRFNVSDQKIRKITIKAFNSKEVVPKKFTNRNKIKDYRGCIYRMFNGVVFVFKLEKKKNLPYQVKKLITVIRERQIT